MDNSDVARRELLLGALEKYVKQGNLELFQTAEWVLTHYVVGSPSDRITDAQARMASADVARWNAARNAMFRRVIGHLDVSTS